MTRGYLYLISWMLACSFAGPLSAGTISFGDKPQRIDLQYGLPTILRFESKVRTISNAENFDIKPANQEVPDYAVLVVTARSTSSEGTVIFILSDGEVARLRFRTMPARTSKTIDTFYDLRPVDTPLSSPEPGKRSEDAADGGRMALMRAMILGEPILGYVPRNPAKPMKTGDDGIEVTLERVYAGSDLNGYVFRIENKTTDKSYTVDIRKLRLGRPNLALLAHIDTSTIEPTGKEKNVAFLTIVAARGVDVHDVVLPVATLNVGKEQGK